MNDPTEQRSAAAHRPRTRGDTTMNGHLESIVRTMTEMEQGLRPIGALDTISSPMAARRIRKLVHGARMSGTGTDGRRRTRVSPSTILSSSSCHPTAGVTEGVVIVAFEERTRPYCIRLEQEGDLWRLVELAPPDAGLRAAVTEASRTGAVPVDEHGVRRSSGRNGIPFSSPPLPEDRVLRIRQDGHHEGSDQHGDATDGGSPSAAG